MHDLQGARLRSGKMGVGCKEMEWWRRSYKEFDGIFSENFRK
jgi:hypothetical protein